MPHAILISLGRPLASARWEKWQALELYSGEVTSSVEH